MVTKHIRVVSGAPIEVGARHLLPAVLVTTREGETSGNTFFHFVKARPISIVEKTKDGAHWLEIPNATEDTVHTMMMVGAGLAAVSALLILLAQLIRKH